MVVAIAIFTLAAAWTRYDATTALGIAGIFPHTVLADDCVSDVLGRADLERLRSKGMPQGVPVIFVARCSPCAAATVGRILAKNPEMRVVAGDSTLSSLVGGRLIVDPTPQATCVKVERQSL